MSLFIKLFSALLKTSRSVRAGRLVLACQPRTPPSSTCSTALTASCPTDVGSSEFGCLVRSSPPRLARLRHSRSSCAMRMDCNQWSETSCEPSCKGCSSVRIQITPLQGCEAVINSAGARPRKKRRGCEIRPPAQLHLHDSAIIRSPSSSPLSAPLQLES